MTKILFIPLSKIIGGCNIYNSFISFSELKTKGSYFPAYVHLPSVYLSFMLDNYYYHTIDDYKLGKISTEEFRSRVSNQLGINVDNKEFDGAWNKMCEIAEENYTHIQDIFSLIKSIKYEIYPVSFSNQLQIEFISSQIIDVLKRTDASEECKNINFINSFQNHMKNYNSLINMTIAAQGLDVESNQFFFFDINPEGGYYVPSHAQVIQADFQEFLGCLRSYSSSENCGMYVD